MELTTEQLAEAVAKIATDRNTEILIKLSAHETRLGVMEVDIHEIKGDIKSILETVAMMKGGYRVMFAIGSIAAAVGAGIAWVISVWKGLPH